MAPARLRRCSLLRKAIWSGAGERTCWISFILATEGPRLECLLRAHLGFLSP